MQDPGTTRPSGVKRETANVSARGEELIELVLELKLVRIMDVAALRIDLCRRVQQIGKTSATH